MVADHCPDAPEHGVAAVFDIRHFVPAQLQAPGTRFDGFGGGKEPGAVPGADREFFAVEYQDRPPSCAVRIRTAMNCLPGSSSRKRPWTVSGRVSMVMFQVSMMSTA